MKTLVAASINEDNYFNNLLGNDIAKIAKDLRATHEKDSDTGDPITPVEDMLGTFEELKKTDNATQAQMIMYSKLFKIKINFTKMDPYEFKTFTDILQRYSDLCNPVRPWPEEKIITRRRLVRENSRNSFSHEKRRTNTCH